MSRFSLLIAGLACGTFAANAPDLFAHGGQWTPPGDTVPPAPPPGPPTGGPPTGGPTTPPSTGPQGPTTPTGPRGPTTPPSGGSSGGTRGPSVGTGIGKKPPRETAEDWEFWWDANQDPYLDLDARLRAGRTTSGRDGFLSGDGRADEATVTRISDAEVQDVIVPLLKSALRESDPDIVDSAVLALGRIVRADSAYLVLDDIVNTLRIENHSVRQSAILALGALESTDGVAILREILADTEEGRRLLGQRGAVRLFERAFAAISLGMIGAPETAAVLLETAARGDEREIQASAILALGLFRDGRESIVPALMELLRDERLDSEVRAQIPVSLGRLGETAQPALPLLAQMARSRRTDDRIRESCVIAMGLLAPADDKEAIELLVKIIDADARNHTSQFAFIALAQIGGRAAADPQLHQETAQSVGRYLLRALTHSDRASHRPWGALALALFGREFAPDSEQRVTAVEKLTRVFEEEDNPSRAAACAIALGLVDARGAGPQLFDRLLDTRDPYLLGYLAVTLGMIQHREALDQLRTLVLDDRDSKLRQQAATALGLMGDFEATPLLVEALRDAKTLHVTASVAKALGLVGDRACIAPLSELVRDEKAPGLARAFGCVALGLIAEKFEHHWNTRLSTNANYRAFLQSQIEILDIL